MVFGVFDPIKRSALAGFLTHAESDISMKESFDGASQLHPGHISFLEQAARYGDELIVVVTRDEMVYKLKKKVPIHSEAVRMHTVEEIECVHQAILGDIVLGSYDIVRSHRPDIICLGYDQHGLREDLYLRMARGELASFELAMMKPHEADRFHTSLLTDMI